MGAELGAQLRSAGHSMVWVSAGRSAESAGRARAAGFVDVHSLDALATRCAVVVSVCPPANAAEVARSTLDAGFVGLFVDANAIGPDTARLVGDLVTDRGGRFVDGGIVGPPPAVAGTTRLFLSGPDAAEAGALFTGTTIDTVLLGELVGAASAVKAAYAGWTKGSTALLLAVRSFARTWGIEGALLDEWHRSIPELPGRSTAEAERVHRKAWRFEGEMREIERALAAAGLPAGFHSAAAELYAQLADLKNDPDSQDAGLVLDLLRQSRPPD